MPDITFKPAGKTVYVETGTELWKAAEQAGLQLALPCGGEGVCGDCSVQVLSGEVDDEASLGNLSEAMVAGGYVLACSTRVANSPVVIEIPEQKGWEGGKFGDDTGRLDLIQPQLLPKEEDIDFISTRFYLEIPSPEEQPDLSDLDRLNRAVTSVWGTEFVDYPLEVIRSLARTLRADSGHATVTLVRQAIGYRMIDITAGKVPEVHFAVAVDIGTTTIAVQLIEVPTAKVVATVSDYNQQIDCGLDVISRINYALKSNGLDVLRSRALETVNTLIDRLCRQNEITSQNIYSVYISGNTTMTHLLLGLDPQFIRIAPYTPTIYQAPNVTAVELAIQVHPLAPVLVSPCVGSYVGGDIAAGLLCSDLAYDGETISLYMDIGTNGELVLGNRDFLVACACSAGPAFEGGGLGCGMRAAYGAIDSVEIDPQSGLASYTTVGNGSPRGICGSGVISLLSKLFLTGWLDPSGKLNRDRPSPAIRIAGRRARYILVPAENSHTGQPIYLTEVDIEHIIRAKAAVYAACKLMLDQVGITFLDIATVYISGGFGRFLDINSAKVIGLIPDLSNDTFRYLGNASLIGTYMVLVSEKHRRLLSTTARRMTYMELNTDPSYMDQYSAALFLPHTDLAFFPSVRPRRNDDENVDT